MALNFLNGGMDAMLRIMEGLQAPERMPNHVVTWREDDYPCVISTERRGETVQLGGDLVEVAITIIIRFSALAPMYDSSIDSGDDLPPITSDNDRIPPSPNHNIFLKSRNRTYRIIEVRFDAATSHYSLDCADPYRP